MEIKKWNKKEDIFEGELDPIYKTLDFCDVFYITDMGYAVLNHQPDYDVYRRMGMTEIQDVFVLNDSRGQGVATALIRHCEEMIKGDMVGICVPVSPQFGAAQRLYFKLGYQPDGNGVTYDRQAVNHGAMVKVDDGLCLMLIKDLD